MLKLNFVEAARPTAIERRQKSGRELTVEALNDQIGLIEATIAGKSFKVTREVYRKGEDGKTRKVKLEVTPRPWFWLSGDGYLAHVRLGNAIVDLSGEGKTAFQAGKDLKAVLATMKSVRDAVAAGHADAQIEATRAAMKRSKAE